MSTCHLTGLRADSPLDFLAVLGMAHLAPEGTRLRFDGLTPVLEAAGYDTVALGDSIFATLEYATRSAVVAGRTVAEHLPPQNLPALSALDELVDASWDGVLPVNLTGIARWAGQLSEKGQAPAHSMYFGTGATHLQASLRDSWKTKPTASEVTAVLEGGTFTASLMDKSPFRFYPLGVADPVMNGHGKSTVAPLAEMFAMTGALALPAAFRRRVDGEEFIEWTVNPVPMSAAAVTALQVTGNPVASFTRYRAPVHRGDKGRSHFSGMGVPVTGA